MNGVFRPILLALIGGVVANEARYGISQQIDRNSQAVSARAYADKVGKPMLVAGGPIGMKSWLAKLFDIKHDPGDVCVDIDPSACNLPTAREVVVADIRNIPYPDKYFGSALASHILEHMPTVDDGIAAYNELNRVADRVFIAVPKKSAIWPHLISREFHPLWVWEEGGQIYFQER